MKAEKSQYTDLSEGGASGLFPYAHRLNEKRFSI